DHFAKKDRFPSTFWRLAAAWLRRTAAHNRPERTRGGAGSGESSVREIADRRKRGGSPESYRSALVGAEFGALGQDFPGWRFPARHQLRNDAAQSRTPRGLPRAGLAIFVASRNDCLALCLRSCFGLSSPASRTFTPSIRC